MRQQWGMLLLRSYRRFHLSYPSFSSHFQVSSISARSISSLLHTCPAHGALLESQRHRSFYLPLRSSFSLKNPETRNYSSEPAVEEKLSDHAVVIDVFSRLSDKDETRKELDTNGIVFSHDLGLKALRGLQSNPDAAKRLFQWILEADARKLSSKSYNSMLCILGVNGFVDEFWGLIDTMKKKGYGISAFVRDKVGERFQKDGLESDLEMLKGVFTSGSMDNSVEKVCNRVCKIVRKEEWSADVEKRLRDIKAEFSSDLVRMIVENLDIEPRKALLFFRWIDESNLFKHDMKTYNAIAKVLGRDKFLDRFWNVIGEMRGAGHEMEMETYVRVSARFCQTKLIKEAVELFEFAMAGSNSPTSHCCTLLLKKVVTAKELDIELFSRVVKAYTGVGNVLTDSVLKSVLKSLRSVDRFGKCNAVLKAMKEGGFVASGDLQSEIALGLSRKGKKDEASELENFLKESGTDLDDKALASLVEGYCDAGELGKASECFKKLVGKESGVSYVGYAFERLVLAYCNKSRARDAYKLLYEHVEPTQLKPWHSTYKILVRNLLTKKIAGDGGFEEALSLLPLMKNHGFPPFVDPFIDYISKTGTGADAFAFLKAMTSKKFPSISVVLRVLESMLKSARHTEAHDLLSQCPNYIRCHADVLELFNAMKPGECTTEKALSSLV